METLGRFNLSTFREKIHHIGRNQYFEVFIPSVFGANHDVATAFARSTTMPPKTHETIDVYYRGLPMKIDGRATFDTWSINFLSDEAQHVRNSFMTWMEAAYNVSQLESRTHGLYKQDNVLVRKIQSNGTPVNAIKFYGIWPTTVGEVELTQDGGDVETFEVTFTYDYWLLGDGQNISSDPSQGVDINVDGKGRTNGSKGQGSTIQSEVVTYPRLNI
jgi:hypothetical protein